MSALEPLFSEYDSIGEAQIASHNTTHFASVQPPDLLCLDLSKQPNFIETKARL